MKADILRDRFLDFFKSKKHKIIASDSLVPKDDPTVLFTPAGMNQFKKEFLGFDTGLRRIATCQRCLRTDDLDKVGRTCGHHTFFEMLGNFSFGDYFKEEAVSFAWEFLTGELKIKKEKLWVSIYKDDDETCRIWKDKIKIPQNKIIKLTDKENFWPSESRQNGPNGPCGPCSEIFFDQGKDRGCQRIQCNPACNCGRFVEVWNLVFTQFNRKEGGILEPLPKKNIDTGMGLERLTAVTQGVYTNFETELFLPIIKEITLSFKPPALNHKEEVFAIADHIRAIVFAIFDEVLPSNETRGYVVRKLIRKSSIHLRKLAVKQPFLYKLVPLVSEIMKRPYPELEARKENIAEIILEEEKNFISTLNSSSALFQEKFKDFLDRSDPERVGEIAFQLYDTYGIPLELTREWLKAHAIMIQEEVFNKGLNAQKMRSKLQSLMRGNVFDIKGLNLDIKETIFLGYKDYSNRARIIKIIKDGLEGGLSEIKKINKGDEVKIIIDRTVFYPESGGQIGDIGEIVRAVRKTKNIFEVFDTQKIGKLILHLGKVKEGSFKKGDFVLSQINTTRRISIARNHTATHLLQAALRRVLGPHVKQEGSLVAADRLRFDFTHFKDIDKATLDRIEEKINSFILDNYSVNVQEMSLSQARKIGALAFFGDKYEERVRVVLIPGISIEFCGGTHLNSTAPIGIFKIIQEGSVASGIRRIEAVTGSFAYKLFKEQENIILDISSNLNVPTQNIMPELEKRLSRNRALERQLRLERLDMIRDSLEILIKNAQKINDVSVIARLIQNLDMSLLRQVVDLIKQRANGAVIALGSTYEGRALLVIAITTDLVQKGLDASKLILDTAKIIGGSGGGRKDFAQAGGNKPENFDAAFAQLKNSIANLL